VNQVSITNNSDYYLDEEESRFKIEHDANAIWISSFEGQILNKLTKVPTQGLTVIIMPTSTNISKELGLSGELPREDVAVLNSELFPNQARTLMGGVSQGLYKYLFMTPESFHNWFSSAISEESLRRPSDGELEAQNRKTAKDILSKVGRFVITEFETTCKENPTFKQKYLDCINLIKKLNKPVLAMSFNCSHESLKHIYKYFPKSTLLQDRLRLERLSLRPKFFFAVADKQKYLVKLLEEERPTLVYISEQENLMELINYLRAKLPNRSIRGIHKGMNPEQQTEALDYFFQDPAPIFFASRDNIAQLHRNDSIRLIHYSLPVSLPEYYRDIYRIWRKNRQTTKSNVNSIKLYQAHLLLCEDDFILMNKERNRLTFQLNREGFQADLNTLGKQILDWMSIDKECRWQSFESMLSPESPKMERCGICDVCLGEKTSLMNKFMMMLAKSKLK
jgi:superfamily II DNA helicase RecQ